MKNDYVLFVDVKGEVSSTNSEFEKIQRHFGKVEMCVVKTAGDLTECLSGRNNMPLVLHAATHGTPFSEIKFANNEVEKRVFTDFLRQYKQRGLQYVVLSVCHSRSLAREIAKEVGLTVVGFEDAITNDGAVDWANWFYGALALDRNFYEAYISAKSSWKASNRRGEPFLYFGDALAWSQSEWKDRLQELKANAHLPDILTELGFASATPSSHSEYINYLYRDLQLKDFALFDLRDVTLRKYHKFYPYFENELARPFVSGNRNEKLSPVGFEEVRKVFKGYRRLIYPFLSKYAKYEKAFHLLGSDTDVPEVISTFRQFIPLFYMYRHETRDERFAKEFIAVSDYEKRCDMLNKFVGSDAYSEEFLDKISRAKQVQGNKVLVVNDLLMYCQSIRKRTPIYSFQDDFVKEMQEGKSKYYLLLGDAGTGKSTILRWIFARLAVRKKAGKVLLANCASDLFAVYTLPKEDKENTLLLLDAFDEAPAAIANADKLFREIENGTKDFRKVLIASREQFFPGALRQRTAMDGGKNFDYKHLFLCYLDEKEFKNKLSQLYKKDSTKLKKAHEIFAANRQLMVRPLIFAFLKEIIDEAMEKGITHLTSYEIYEIMVDKWLQREDKVLEPEKVNALFKAMMALAYEAYQRTTTSGNKYWLTTSEIEKVIKKEEKTLESLVVVRRSLLKRVIKGGGRIRFAFTHKTFKEFFLAELVFQGHISEKDLDKNAFEFTWKFYKELCCVSYHRFKNGENRRSAKEYSCPEAEAKTLVPNYALNVYFTQEKIRLDNSDFLFPPLEKVLLRNVYDELKAYLLTLAKVYVENDWDAIDDKKLLETTGWPEETMEAFLEEFRNLPFVVEQWDENGTCQYDFWHRSFADFLYLYPLYEESDEEKFLAMRASFDFEKVRFKDLFGKEIERLKNFKFTKILADYWVDNNIEFEEMLRQVREGIYGSWPEAMEARMRIDERRDAFSRMAGAHALFVGGEKRLQDDLVPEAFEQGFKGEKGTLWIRKTKIKEYTPVYVEQFAKDEAVFPKMKQIPAGNFLRGTEDFAYAMPVVQVSIRAFELAEAPVRVQEFAVFVKKTAYLTVAEREGWSFAYHKSRARWGGRVGCHWQFDEYGKPFGKERANYAVIHVSWYDAIAYCNWLSEQKGYAPAYDEEGNFIDENGKPTNDLDKVKGFRLPTEAEWEYAAGEGARHRKWAGTDEERELSEYACYDQDQMIAVKQRKPNAFGLFDMSGNVWEWCQDKWHDDYEHAPKDGRAWLSGSSPYRIVRGGSWNYGARDCRVAIRYYSHPRDRHYSLGFRLARSS